ncbi:MAG: phenylalanine--tRNA ligase subunit beta [Sideroxydans sp.]
MQFSESWLRTFVNPPLSSEALSHLLTMAGLEVEDRRPVAPAFDRVVVAEVLAKEKHPDADRLNVLQVDVGQPEPLTVVCGAGNVMVGMKAPCALVGAKLPGIEIRQAKVRGVVSFGMMCSEKELGLAAESEGLMVLPHDAPVGQPLRDYLQLDDHLFTLKLTPNRSDCLSVQGIAREVAALTGASLRALPAACFSQTASREMQVTVTATEACPRYAGRVITGVNAKAVTPAWMVQRLQRSGLRSISALVDVTNYVLLELGQPLHAFDLNKLSGELAVRFARQGEALTLLNGQTVSLGDDTLVIADARGAVALAGIMGGADSAVDEQTTDIFLESAYFEPAVIAGKSRTLGVASDSSYRFERGVDFAATRQALDRATQLILDICGGAAGPVNEVQGKLPQRLPVRLRLARLTRVLGISLDADQVGGIFTRLGMTFSRAGDDFFVTPPSYRFDLAIEEDLIEEVARVYGYDNIQPAQVHGVMRMLAQPAHQRPAMVVRQAMTRRDYQEVITYSFVEAEWERTLCGNDTPLLLKNPIASQMSAMRSSLLGGLLNTLRGNLARKQARVRLFEIGGCFARSAAGYTQTDYLSALAYGDALPEQWGSAARPCDFYDAKGDLEALFHPRKLEFEAVSHPACHPGRTARVWWQGRPIGWIGELHPRWQQAFDLPQAPLWFEVELSALLADALPQLQRVSRLPPVRRDIAVLVDDTVSAHSLLAAAQSASAPYVTEFALFDLYRGKGLPIGKKSLAFRVLLQDTEKTLTEKEIESSISLLVQTLEKHGAQLRFQGDV